MHLNWNEQNKRSERNDLPFINFDLENSAAFSPVAVTFVRDGGHSDSADSKHI